MKVLLKTEKGIVKNNPSFIKKIFSHNKTYNVIYFTVVFGPAIFFTLRNEGKFGEKVEENNIKKGILWEPVSNEFLKNHLNPIGFVLYAKDLENFLKEGNVDAVITDHKQIENVKIYGSEELLIKLKEKYGFAIIVLEDKKLHEPIHTNYIDYTIPVDFMSFNQNPEKIENMTPILKKTSDFIKNYKPSTSHKLQEYLFNLFPTVPPEVLENLVHKLDHECKSISSITNQTYSGAVGSINFELGGKHFIFKIYNKKKEHNAKIEFLVGKAINKDEDLKHVCPEMFVAKDQKDPFEFDGFFLILTEDVRYKNIHLITAKEHRLTHKLYSNVIDKFWQNPEIIHKLYVIALVHSRLKKYIKKEDLKNIHKTSFFSYHYVKDRIESNIPGFKEELKELRHIYRDIVHKHKTFDESVIVHNDPKWDNFVDGHLIDFGSVHSSTPYNDLARIFLLYAFKHHFKLDGYISAYVFFRIHLDHHYKHSHDLKSKYHNIYLNTYERIISESLRIAQFKSSIGHDRIAKELIYVAASMAKKIHDADYKGIIHHVKHKMEVHVVNAKKEFKLMKRAA